MPPDTTASRQEFLRLQQAFAQYLRDPSASSAPVAAEDRRLAIYRNAIFSNVSGLMADNYPRIRDLLSQDDWDRMMRDYIVRHSATTRAFIDVPKEFLAYLESERDTTDDLPFFFELAHFDWLETLIGGDPRRLDLTGINPDGDLLTGRPVVNPLLRREEYVYPVHAINASYQPSSPPPRVTHIAAFRDRSNQYGFLDLNEAAAALLDAVMAQGGSATGADIIRDLATRLGAADGDSLLEPGREILARMRARDAILGTRN